MKRSMWMRSGAAFLALSVGLGTWAVAETPAETPAAPAADKQAEAAKPYPLDTCLVSGEKLDEMGEPQVIVHEGQEVKFCCKMCIKKFKADPEKYLKKMNEEAAKKDETKTKE